jgi:RNA polymerase sporulation-specific sigma factor
MWDCYLLLLTLIRSVFTLADGSRSFPRAGNGRKRRNISGSMAAGDEDARSALRAQPAPGGDILTNTTPHRRSGDPFSIGTIASSRASPPSTPAKIVRLAPYASRCIENEILILLPGQRKVAGELSLQDTLDGDD